MGKSHLLNGALSWVDRCGVPVISLSLAAWTGIVWRQSSPTACWRSACFASSPLSPCLWWLNFLVFCLPWPLEEGQSLLQSWYLQDTLPGLWIQLPFLRVNRKSFSHIQQPLLLHDIPLIPSGAVMGFLLCHLAFHQLKNPNMSRDRSIYSSQIHWTIHGWKPDYCLAEDEMGGAEQTVMVRISF